MSGAARLAAACALLTLPVLATGCVERRIFITSEPAGALVQLNDVEVGRTPLEIDFEWHGVYDVLLTLEGHEPLRTTARADAPIYEWPGFDLVAAALPMTFRNHIHWRFELEPIDRDQGALLERARELRDMIDTPADAPAEGEDAP